MIAFYVSGHGLGHASRQIEIINAVRRLHPGARISVRSSAARWLFDLTLSSPVELEAAACDTGIVQIDSLRPDVEASLREAASFVRTIDERARREAEWLSASGTRLVVGDIPPLAFMAARRAGLPSVAIANFTWDWIYEGYATVHREAAPLAARLGTLYGLADAAWRLPMYGGFEGMASVADLPLVARRSHRDPTEVRTALGLPGDERLALVSFGGYGLDGLALARAAATSGHRVVVVEGGAGKRRTAPDRRVHVIAEADVYGAGYRYEDLVRAVDVVVTKPGYGIVAECAANDTAMLYTSRGWFREYDVLVEALPRYLRSAYIPQEALLRGEWREAMDRLEKAAAPLERPRTDGAERAARALVTLAEGGRAALDPGVSP